MTVETLPRRANVPSTHACDHNSKRPPFAVQNYKRPQTGSSTAESQQKDGLEEGVAHALDPLKNSACGTPPEAWGTALKIRLAMPRECPPPKKKQEHVSS